MNAKKCQIPKQAINLAAIDLNWLTNCEIKGIILDLDNTLISEDDYYLSPGGETWIEKAKSGGVKFFILSNGKFRSSSNKRC